MKKLKRMDMWISTGLIAGFAIASLINRDYTFIIGYFVVGSWQVISMTVHAVNGWFTEKWKLRYVYHWITFIALITIPIGSFWVLLFTAPFVAVYYTWLCYSEVRKMNERPLAILK